MKCICTKDIIFDVLKEANDISKYLNIEIETPLISQCHFRKHNKYKMKYTESPCLLMILVDSISPIYIYILKERFNKYFLSEVDYRNLRINLLYDTEAS